MIRDRKWDPCVYHLDTDEVRNFASVHFGESGRKCLLICGAGFDPRSYKVCEFLSEIMGDRLEGYFIREERPNPDSSLLNRANQNHENLRRLVSSSNSIYIEIFSSDDGAPIAGQSTVRSMESVPIHEYHDLVVDLSALSVGVSFPLVRYLQQKLESDRLAINLHIMVAASNRIDRTITSEPSDRVAYVRGFDGQGGITGLSPKAKLWLPQLANGKNDVLERIRQHDLVNADDICPILPFPSADPRRADDLAESFLAEFAGPAEFSRDWGIDGKDIVYVDESNPLDVYRTILGIDDERQRIFEELGGSVQILSPTGSRLLSIGAVMAALDRNLPVVYVESMGYSLDSETAEEVSDLEPHFVHVWLEGDVYPPRHHP